MQSSKTCHLADLSQIYTFIYLRVILFMSPYISYEIFLPYFIIFLIITFISFAFMCYYLYSILLQAYPLHSLFTSNCPIYLPSTCQEFRHLFMFMHLYEVSLPMLISLLGISFIYFIIITYWIIDMSIYILLLIPISFISLLILYISYLYFCYLPVDLYYTHL